MDRAAVHADAAATSQSSADEEPPWETVPGAPVHLEWLNRAFAAAQVAAASFEQPELLSRAHLAKDQLAVVQKYTRICERFRDYGAKLLTKQRPLVPVRFPVKPLPNTRVMINERLGRSYANFVRHLHEQTLSIAPQRLAPVTSADMAEVVEFVQTMAGALWSESRRVIDDESSEHEARTRMLRRCARFARTCHESHCKQLGSTRNHCRAAWTELDEFCRNRALSKRQLASEHSQKAQAKTARQWVRGVLRRGWGLAFEIVCALGRVRAALHDAFGGDEARARVSFFLDAVERARRDDPEDRALWDDDEWAARVYARLAELAPVLQRAAAQACASTDALLARDVEDPCWCSLQAVLDTPEVEATALDSGLLQAPGHMATFTRGRMRVVASCAYVSHGCRSELAGVRLARVLAQLLQEGHLFLHRLGCDFANRIATCEYAKYELYIMRIEADTLIPFGELVGIPYRSRIPNLEEARLAQKRPLPLGAPAG